MTGFAPTLNFVTKPTFTASELPPRRTVSLKVRSVEKQLEAGLDRLLSDIERFEETERWDGMS